MLREAGYMVRRDAKDLHVVDSVAGVEFFYLRPRDIATYVGLGSLDAGFTGLDLLQDSRSKATVIADLGFGGSTLRFAGPIGTFKEPKDLAGKRLATAYPNLVSDYLEANGIKAEIISLDGAVEVSVQLGVADAVADVKEEVAKALAEINASLTNAFGDLAATVKSLHEQVAAVTKSLDTVTGEVNNIKGNFNEFGKIVGFPRMYE